MSRSEEEFELLDTSKRGRSSRARRATQRREGEGRTSILKRRQWAVHVPVVVFSTLVVVLVHRLEVSDEIPDLSAVTQFVTLLFAALIVLLFTQPVDTENDVRADEAQVRETYDSLREKLEAIGKKGVVRGLEEEMEAYMTDPKATLSGVRRKMRGLWAIEGVDASTQQTLDGWHNDILVCTAKAHKLAEEDIPVHIRQYAEALLVLFLGGIVPLSVVGSGLSLGWSLGGTYAVDAVYLTLYGVISTHFNRKSLL